MSLSNANFAYCVPLLLRILMTSFKAGIKSGHLGESLRENIFNNETLKGCELSSVVECLSSI